MQEFQTVNKPPSNKPPPPHDDEDLDKDYCLNLDCSFILMENRSLNNEPFTRHMSNNFISPLEHALLSNKPSPKKYQKISPQGANSRIYGIYSIYRLPVVLLGYTTSSQESQGVFCLLLILIMSLEFHTCFSISKYICKNFCK